MSTSRTSRKGSEPLPSEEKPEEATIETPSDSDPISPPDPFDPATLRLSQDPLAATGVKKALIRVPVRKPLPEVFIRVHPGKDYRLDTAVIDFREDRETYLVAPELRDELCAEIKPVRLYTTISRQGVVALWPCRLPSPDGRQNAWHETALQCAELAMTRWIKILADMGWVVISRFSPAATCRSRSGRNSRSMSFCVSPSGRSTSIGPIIR